MSGLISSTPFATTTLLNPHHGLDRGGTEDPDLEGLLARLDDPVPAVPIESVVARARRAEATRLWILSRAAILVVGLGAVAGGVYALPNSPLNRWLRSFGQRFGWPEPIVTVPPAMAAVRPDQGGLLLEPGDLLVVRFLEPAAGVVVVARGDGPALEIRSSSPGTAFALEPSRLLVTHLTEDTVEVRLPRIAARLEIQIGNRSVLVQEDSTIISSRAPGVTALWSIPLGNGP